MRWEEYRKNTAEELGKRRWRTTRVLRNGYLSIPIGTEVSITGKRNGFDLESEPCAHCGVQIFIKRVEPGALEEIL